MTRPPQQLTLGISLGSELDFEHFIVGENSALLSHTARLAGMPQFLYLWGERGSGKTHLLHAACQALALTDRRVALLPLLQAGRWQPEMLEGWEALDLVALDDIHGIAGRADWERQLFALYNALRDSGASLLVTADRPPAALPFSLPDLQSRLGAMLIYQVHALDDEGKMEALTCKAKARGMELPTDVARYLLTRVSRNMADLGALLERLDRVSLARQRRLTIPFVREQLDNDREI